ncbi:MAG: uridine kinase [Defluviitaleaceae bacterium]|nr:uridine kinase [Defluviitaleaceae bacterium]
MKSFIIAIDGRAASGKTTLAAALAAEEKASVIHMDDFFLPPNLRTTERLNTPGGNIHHERFAEEVLPFIADGKPFQYRVFDCATCTYTTTRKIIHPLIIVEGAYSHHPLFGSYMNLRIFSDISPEPQIRRIKNRNGTQAATVFASKWIPLEEKYLSTFEIYANADIILSTQ